MAIINYDILPEHMQGAMQRYIEHGIPPGSFLEAVLSNDLMQTFARADYINQQAIPAFVNFLYNEAPSNCHGSAAAFYGWVEQHGLQKETENV